MTTPAERLKKYLGADVFKRWFKGAYFEKDAVCVPLGFQAEWIRNHFETALFNAFGFLPKVIQAEPLANLPAKIKATEQLGFWEDNKRGCSNSLLRAALFPPLGRGKRHFLKGVKLAGVGGVEVVFTGEQFDQTDLDVYLEILNFARPFPLGAPVSFSARGMLKALGKSSGGDLHKWLHSVFTRLRGGTIDITDKKVRYMGGLIKRGILEEAEKFYTIEIDTEFAKLFGFGMWSKIDVKERRALKGPSSEIAKALHAYYSTHAAPTLHTYETLVKVLGLSGALNRQTKARLIEAHERLEKIGFLSGFDVRENGILPLKNDTPAQKKHLAKKAAT